LVSAYTEAVISLHYAFGEIKEKRKKKKAKNSTLAQMTMTLSSRNDPAASHLTLSRVYPHDSDKIISALIYSRSRDFNRRRLKNSISRESFPLHFMSSSINLLPSL